jgi:hypothetical protein
MTVKELMECLKKQPQDLEVYTEGCDCIGPCGSVDTITQDPYMGETIETKVLLMRS